MPSPEIFIQTLSTLPSSFMPAIHAFRYSGVRSQGTPQWSTQIIVSGAIAASLAIFG